MLTPAGTYAELVAGFRWRVPARYNIGADVCDRHAAGNPLALIHVEADGATRSYGFEDLRRWSNRLALAGSA